MTQLSYPNVSYWNFAEAHGVAAVMDQLMGA